MSLAVAISLYDRWDELQGLLELLRLNWKTGKNLYIVVVTTAEQRQVPAWVNQQLADYWEFGSQYSLPKQRTSWFQPLHDRRYGRFKRQLRTRTVDCICRGCRQALASGREYTLHLHAAAWPLMEEKIYGIINHMRNGSYVAAGRGYGKALVDDKHPAGDIDDNFFITENNFARASDFWNINPASDTEVMGAEGKIARRLRELNVEERMYFYDTFAKPEEYLFPPSTSPRRVQPYNYHHRLGLLRSHNMSFQAKLCWEFGFRGPFIDQLVNKNGASWHRS